MKFLEWRVSTDTSWVVTANHDRANLAFAHYSIELEAILTRPISSLAENASLSSKQLVLFCIADPVVAVAVLDMTVRSITLHSRVVGSDQGLRVYRPDIQRKKRP